MVVVDQLGLLVTFAVVLLAAEVGSLAARAVRLPGVVGMLAVGALVGPHVNPFSDAIGIRVPAVGDLAFLGGLFLMLSIGLTFNLRSLLTVGPRGFVLGFAAAFLSFAAGVVVGVGFGLSRDTAFFVGLLLAPTSSTIALRLADEQRLLGTPGIDLTMSGILLDDVIAIILATFVLALVGGGAAPDWGRLTLGVLLMLALATLVILAAVRALPWTLTFVERASGGAPALFAVSLAFLVAAVFTLIGFPPIFGAFWAGTVLATSRFGPMMEQYTKPLTQVFSAVFFTSIGMLLDPALLPALGLIGLALVVVGSLSKFAGGYWSLRMFRVPALPAAACATLLLPRGEVSLVIAQNAPTPALRAELEVLAAVLLVFTTLAAPLLLGLLRWVSRPRGAASSTTTD